MMRIVDATRTLTLSEVEEVLREVLDPESVWSTLEETLEETTKLSPKTLSTVGEALNAVIEDRVNEAVSALIHASAFATP